MFQTLSKYSLLPDNSKFSSKSKEFREEPSKVRNKFRSGFCNVLLPILDMQF